jgi:hypothetical protein
VAKLPDNARLGLTLYFKSPSLSQIMFIDVDASPDDDGEVELFPEGIAELSRRWCARRHERKSSPTSSDKTAWTRDGPSQRPLRLLMVSRRCPCAAPPAPSSPVL